MAKAHNNRNNVLRTGADKQGIAIVENGDWRTPLEGDVTVSGEMLVRLGEMEDRIIPMESFESLVRQVDSLQSKLTLLEKTVGIFYAEYLLEDSLHLTNAHQRWRAYNWFMRKWYDRRTIRKATAATVKAFKMLS